jgi:hypothetical protein
MADVASDGTSFVAVGGKNILQAVPPFQLRQLVMSPAIGVMLALDGAIHQTVDVQLSDNLPNWTLLTSLQASNHSVLLQDQSATNSQARVYRVVIGSH